MRKRLFESSSPEALKPSLVRTVPPGRFLLLLTHRDVFIRDSLRDFAKESRNLTNFSETLVVLHFTGKNRVAQEPDVWASQRWWRPIPVK